MLSLPTICDLSSQAALIVSFGIGIIGITSNLYIYNLGSTSWQAQGVLRKLTTELAADFFDFAFLLFWACLFLKPFNSSPWVECYCWPVGRVHFNSPVPMPPPLPIHFPKTNIYIYILYIYKFALPLASLAAVLPWWLWSWPTSIGSWFFIRCLGSANTAHLILDYSNCKCDFFLELLWSSANTKCTQMQAESSGFDWLYIIQHQNKELNANESKLEAWLWH